ncbi:MAG TPA: 50S ribosomal protein L6 [Candidatus Avidehalobacter gallistercoris]|uniref:Large ribosomal subunit protein uL6 n=1 Tax=Candidatus Avidehalobacter gallistercoris TaxID=2840694 RepID=A0A9D1HLQ3_9FIRM|nr:50S ribosomal protein L6 [Candidatus Avidehalobacter gallistercoris]
MSRIGKLPIAIPAGVDVNVDGRLVTVKGPKGEMSRTVRPEVTVKVEDGNILVTRDSDEAHVRSYHGLTRALLANMVTGVSTGFERKLTVIGVGYRAAVQNNVLSLNVGKSHPVELPAPEGVQIECPQPTQIVITGPDKEVLGGFAAKIRAQRPPEPYKGKGIRYEGEYVAKKAGKTGAKK